MLRNQSVNAVWRNSFYCWNQPEYINIVCVAKYHSIPYMALQPLPGLGLPHKTPPLIPIFSSSPPSSIPSSCNASLWTTSAHLVLGLPTGLWCRSFRLIPFIRTLSLWKISESVILNLELSTIAKRL